MLTEHCFYIVPGKEQQVQYCNRENWQTVAPAHFFHNPIKEGSHKNIIIFNMMQDNRYFRMNSELVRQKTTSLQVSFITIGMLTSWLIKAELAMRKNVCNAQTLCLRKST